MDLVGVKFLKRLSMEYDFKRKPLNYGEMKVKGYEPHLIFDTEPWDDIINLIRFVIFGNLITRLKDIV